MAEAQLTPARPGAHKALAASGDLNPIELTDLRSTGDRRSRRRRHRPAWRSTAARHPPREAGRDAAGRDWIGLRANEDYVVAGVDQAPLLPTMVVLLLGLGATMLAWRREGALMPFIPGFPRGNRL